MNYERKKKGLFFMKHRVLACLAGVKVGRFHLSLVAGNTKICLEGGG